MGERRSSTRMLGAILLLPLSSVAGEYHYQSTLVCSECHSPEAARGPGGPSALLASIAPPADSTLRDSLDAARSAVGPLKSEDTNELCLSCHDGQAAAPDVLGGHAGRYVRQAGALTTGSAPYEDWKGHTLGVAAVPPGGHAPMTLTCTSCHAPHGNAGYRNLGRDDEQPPPVSYARGTNDLTKDVFLRAGAPGGLGASYGVQGVDFNEPVPGHAAMDVFCASCHSAFYGPDGDPRMGGTDGTRWFLHPTSAADIGAQQSGGLHSSLSAFAANPYRLKVTSPAGEWGIQGMPWAGVAGLSASCVTCHKAHGNQNRSALIALSGQGPPTEDGDAAGARMGPMALCMQCHPVN
jgi:hypothetical protein